jgi:uncharacterized protein
MSQRPLPYKNNMPEAWGFWEGVEQGELRIQRCRRCGGLNPIPKIRCPQDGSELEWVSASGRAEVVTFSVIPAHPVPEFQAEAPYAVAVVMLEEGVPFYTRILTDRPDEIRIGMPVEAVFVPVSESQRLVYFQPVR